MAFAMLLSFAACGGTDDAEETTAPAKTELVTASVYGCPSFKVPADFTEFTEKQPGAKSANNGAGASIAVTDIIDASELPLIHGPKKTTSQIPLLAPLTQKSLSSARTKGFRL